MCLPLATNVTSCNMCSSRTSHANSQRPCSDPRTALSAKNRCCAAEAPPQLTCATRPVKSAEQINAKFYNLHKISKTKSYLFLIIIFCAVLVRTAHAKPVLAAGRRLILHTPEHRQRYHQQLLLQRRIEVPPTPLHRHHLHHRSADNMPMSKSNAAGYSCTFKNVLQQANNTIDSGRRILNDYAMNHLNESIYSMNEKLFLHRLDMEYPFREELRKAVFNLDFNPNAKVTAEKTTDYKQVLQKAYNTLEDLDAIYNIVIDYYEANKIPIVHIIGKQRFADSTKLLGDLRPYVKFDLGELEHLFNELKIDKPPRRNGKPTTVKIDQHHWLEWLMAKEHMIIMQFLYGVYQRLLTRC